MTKLALDPMCVLSAWEQMGGSAFSSDDSHLDDPEAVTLDLSSWEARLKPVSAPCTSQVETNLFSSLFSPAGICFAFLPNCAAVPSAGNGGFFAGEGPQVVPLCPPTVSADSIDNNKSSDGAWVAAVDCCTAMDDAAQGGSHMDDDFNMSIHFSDVEPATSSEAGIVPDFDNGSNSAQQHNPQQGHHHYSGGSSTATSGSLPYTPAPEAQGAATAGGILQLPVLPSHLSVGPGAAPQSLTSAAFFVPVDGQPRAAGQSATGCGGVPVCKQELDNSEAPQRHQQHPPAQPPQPLQPPQPSTGNPVTCAPAAAAARQIAAQPPQQQQQLPPGRSHGSSAAANAGQSQQQQQQQSGGAMHIRTRAECLERYRQKKARRLYTKKIRYQLRKINADKRPRIKGRFVKKEELAGFLATQLGGAMVREEVEDPYFGDAVLDSDDE